MANKPENLFEFDARPIDESNIDPAFVQMVIEAANEPAGPSMTLEEFLEHLECLSQRSGS